MLVFVEGGKPEYPAKNPRSEDENQQQTRPAYDARSGIRTRATLVGGECSHQCAISTPQQNPDSQQRVKKMFSTSFVIRVPPVLSPIYQSGFILISYMRHIKTYVLLIIVIIIY